jgi:hypothetical protein
MRKIIQIATTPNGVIVALCDDGTVWVSNGGKWSPTPYIPQDKPGDEK